MKAPRRILTVLGAIGVMLLTPAVALAHGDLVSSTPSAGAALANVPGELRLRFSEAVELAFTRLALSGPDGSVALGELDIHPDSSRVLIAPIAGRLAAGRYTVNWQVAGADGHPVRGEYTFTVTAEAEGSSGVSSGSTDAPVGPTAPGQETPPAEHHEGATVTSTSEFGAESLLYVVVRWLTFVGLLGVIGVVVFRSLVLWLIGRKKDGIGDKIVGPAAIRSARVGIFAVALLAAALFFRLYAQSWAVHGATEALDMGRIGTMLAQTTWGWGWLLQAVGTALALIGFWIARRDLKMGWILAGVGVILLAFTPGLSGHAVATDGLTGLAVLADALHVLGAGGWLGSLLLVVLVGIPVALDRPVAERGSTVAALINAFSPTALFFAGTVVATGVFAAWLQLQSVPALWQSSYGRTLLLKLAFLSVVFGTGAYNWLKVKPALGDEVAAGRLRRSAQLELGVGVIVLGVTAVLVATATPSANMERAGESSPSGGQVNATENASNISLK